MKISTRTLIKPTDPAMAMAYRDNLFADAIHSTQ